MTSPLPSPTNDLPHELVGLLDEAQQLAADAVAPNTRRAYKSDWTNFANWCETHGLASLPATGETVALYLTDQAHQVKVSTLKRRLSSISMAHQHAQEPTPTNSIEVKRVMQGLTRRHGTAATKKKPLRTADIRRLADCFSDDTLAGYRDHALILIGFAGGLRRSELVALDVEDLEETNDGLIITLRRSKTDQEGQSRRIGIPYGSNPRTCPVRTTRTWCNQADITTGPLWRPVNRHDQIIDRRLTPQSVALIIKRTTQCAGLNPELFAGHSLRSGFATSAAEAGASERAIMRQTGHRSLPVLRGYIEEGTIFADNAATKIGL